MKYKTLFISDTHLGTRNSQADKLLKFLVDNEFEKIYLVGDIIDMIAMKKKFYWKKNHNNVIQKLLKLSKKIEVIYIVGNHDIFLESFIGESFGNIMIKESDIHTSIDNKEYMIIHGHQFDGALMTYTWLYSLGSVAYDLSVWLNGIYNNLRKYLGMDYWSLSLFLKKKTKNAINFINSFEEVLSNYAKENGVSNIIAGHIHMSGDKIINDVRYINCGCWTEFTSCVIEDLEGKIHILEIV